MKQKTIVFSLLMLMAAIVIAYMMITIAFMRQASASWVPTKIGGSQRQQDIIAWAWKISPDPDFIATLEAENGTWEENRVGVTGDVGLCQMRPSSWNWWIKDPRFQDYKQQILMCAAEYKKAADRGCIGCTFHGYYNKEKTKLNFIFYNN